MNEITFELTNYCPHDCKYCSSDTMTEREHAVWLPIEDVKRILGKNRYEHIILSGGEPIAHPRFYDILLRCQQHSDDVIVYSNAIRHIIYNHNVIDGIYLEANITILPEVDKIHILRRVKQGKEANRPEVHLSRNFQEDCSCEHRVVRPNGSIGRHPCDKWHCIEETE